MFSSTNSRENGICVKIRFTDHNHVFILTLIMSKVVDLDIFIRGKGAHTDIMTDPL